MESLFTRTHVGTRGCQPLLAGVNLMSLSVGMLQSEYSYLDLCAIDSYTHAHRHAHMHTCTHTQTHNTYLVTAMSSQLLKV